MKHLLPAFVFAVVALGVTVVACRYFGVKIPEVCGGSCKKTEGDA